MKINEKNERMMTKVKFVKDVIFSSYRKKVCKYRNPAKSLLLIDKRF